MNTKKRKTTKNPAPQYWVCYAFVSTYGGGDPILWETSMATSREEVHKRHCRIYGMRRVIETPTSNIRRVYVSTTRPPKITKRTSP